MPTTVAPEKSGEDALWTWFGLDRCSWLTLPRVLMHEMPDEWQAKMAKLLEQWDDVYPNKLDIDIHVQARRGNKFAAVPAWLCQYRHPDLRRIEDMKKGGADETAQPSTTAETTHAINTH